jgi:two-component system NtrC family response regulator
MLFNGKILIVDDEQKLRSLFKRIISLEGYEVFESQDLFTAKKILQKEDIAVVICDVRLPDGSGIDFVKFVKIEYPVIEMILFTAFGDISDGIQSMKNGAFDYIIKGNDNDKLIPLLNKAIEKVKLQKRVTKLEKEVKILFGFENIIGKSTGIKQTIALAKKIAPKDVPVLLLGETGTGKELFARAIHSASSRADQPFVAINCSAFSKTLLESELFGHKAGAFTGAIKDKIGLLEEAHGGTLFLDEIGEMDIELQAKLLRVLEAHEFIKVGDTKYSTVDIRIISATNKNLYEEVLTGKFREDLFYRLNVFTVKLPSLSERKTDIPVLAKYFVRIFSKKMNKNIHEMSNSFIEKLLEHTWRGNIRELKNVIERAVIMCDEPFLNEEFLPSDFLLQKISIYTNNNLLDLESIEKNHILKVLIQTKGNKLEAARILKISIATLYRKIDTYGL